MLKNIEQIKVSTTNAQPHQNINENPYANKTTFEQWKTNKLVYFHPANHKVGTCCNHSC